MALEETLESHLDCKEIKSINTIENQPWIFTGRTDAEAKAPILWPPEAKSQLIGKDPAVGKDWMQKEKGTTEDEMVGWCHRLDGREFEQAPGVGDGQGGLACCSPWGCKQTGLSDWRTRNRDWRIRGDFPGSPVVETWPSNAGGMTLIVVVGLRSHILWSVAKT